MRELNAQEAYDLMQADPEYIYLDVRSVPEFDAGHPMRAINIPIMHFAPGTGMSPNRDFATVVQAALAKDAKLVVGCKTGGRSARACEEMSQMGYTNVANVRGGYIGAMDSLGQVSEPGWSMRNLPVCAGCSADDSYEALAARPTRG